MQINRWSDLSNSPWEISLGNFSSQRHAQKNNRPEKFLFIRRNNGIVSTVQWSLKYFFAPNSPLFQKSSVEEKESSVSKSLCFAFAFSVCFLYSIR